MMVALVCSWLGYVSRRVIELAHVARRPLYHGSMAPGSEVAAVQEESFIWRTFVLFYRCLIVLLISCG